MAEIKKINTPESLSTLEYDHAKNTIHDVQALYPEDTDKLYKAKSSKGHQVQELVADRYVHQRSSLFEVSDAVERTEAHPAELQNNTGPGDLLFDEHAMILPHNILGSLEDFRNYLKAKEETDLLKRIPKSLRDLTSEAPGRPPTNTVLREIPSGQRNIQSNALQRWDKHVTQRRQQQDFLSNLQDRPVEKLLMSQADKFRETQEQKEILNQVLPLIHSGYGYRVGSEFWSLPQRFGDELSGITATLTQTELGRQKPVTHVGQPSSIRKELGISAETIRPASRTWDKSAYLHHQYHELREVLQKMDIRKPDISGLEVIGSGKPLSFITVCQSPSLEREAEEKEHKEMNKDNFDLLAQMDDVQVKAQPFPALRFCGHLASWTGNSTSNQGKVGISATIIFEALTGERASSNLELHNEGSTAIFYSWQQLTVPHSLPHLRSQTKNMHFYFNSSSGVICPGDTKCVEFIFKSDKPGIKTELWQLNTHPVLLQGASMHVTLKGMALNQDKTAVQRLFLETKLEKIVVEKLCWSIVHEVLHGVCTPERPSSPAELYITEEQQFQRKNPKLQYVYQPVEDLKRLWQETHQGCIWDLSVDTLQQVVLSLPDEETSLHSPTREESLAQLNSVLLQLSEPSELKHHRLTAVTIGRQLWRKLLDTMADQATRLRNLLGLQEKEMRFKKRSETIISDADVADNGKEDKNEKKDGGAADEERSVMRSRFKDDGKAESRPPMTESLVEESKKTGKRKDDVGRHARGKHGKGSASFISSESIMQRPPDDQNVDPEIIHIYTQILHKKVYAQMEGLLDNLCDLMEEINVGEGQDIKGML
ncbi:MYCBP-associated protein isoform X2 [Melanotaenia boesemani]|uniref:MYCBP-associated protein isoform X2 n=1 Tax=Melanotaenia boesemani TaxID=1250792 RepID=UPI001C0441A2|nr:MYCBP-associated protein isoform X2 [Melanotaenia boesemani]XP_041838294.1 MYCBP-associated protein isoform X2 [Melanotaenia boesemani]